MNARAPAFLRLSSIVNQRAKGDRPARAGIIPVSAATWWAGCKSGRFPKPVYVLGPRIPAWRTEDVMALTAKSEGGDA